MKWCCVLGNSLPLSYEKVIELEDLPMRYVLISYCPINDEHSYGLFFYHLPG